jgi:hypothetical protein
VNRNKITTGQIYGYGRGPGFDESLYPIIVLSSDLHAVPGGSRSIRTLTPNEQSYVTKARDERGNWNRPTSYGLPALRVKSGIHARVKMPISDQAALLLEIRAAYGARDLLGRILTNGGMPDDRLEMFMIFDLAEVRMDWNEAEILLAARKAEREQHQREQNALDERLRAVQQGLREFRLTPNRLSDEFVFSLDEAEELLATLARLHKTTLEDNE